MLVFKEHRSVQDLVKAIFSGSGPPKTEDDAWTILYEEFTRWSTDVHDRASKFRFPNHVDPSLRERRPQFDALLAAEPEFDTSDWWACMVSDRLRNYDAAMRKHGTNMSAVPADLDNLPLFHATVENQTSKQAQEGDASFVGEDDVDMVDPDPDLDGGDADTVLPKLPRNQIPTIAIHCGVLPPGASLSEFHLPPRKMHSRNAEGRYWQEFVERFRDCSPSEHNAPVCRAEEPEWCISSQSALLAMECQSKFCKSIDFTDFDPKCCVRPSCLESAQTLPTPAAVTKESFQGIVDAAIRRLPPVTKKSDTVVMEAAFHLLVVEGLLNVQDLGQMNVKQARALLWNAAWLQEHMSVRWRNEGALQADLPGDGARHFADFALAIMGPGGTGKTAVLKVVEALTVFFVGAETVRKLAPSNAAARLLGGDTMHSMCKLPFGKVTLASKRGRLTKNALKRHRKQWLTAVAAYLDELSMVSADQFLQCDVRMRQGKMNPPETFGGLAINACGDFLQLPPVSRDGSKKSLACVLDDTGH